MAHATLYGPPTSASGANRVPLARHIRYDKQAAAAASRTLFEQEHSTAQHRTAEQPDARPRLSRPSGNDIDTAQRLYRSISSRSRKRHAHCNAGSLVVNLNRWIQCTWAAEQRRNNAKSSPPTRSIRLGAGYRVVTRAWWAALGQHSASLPPTSHPGWTAERDWPLVEAEMLARDGLFAACES